MNLISSLNLAANVWEMWNKNGHINYSANNTQIMGNSTGQMVKILQQKKKKPQHVKSNGGENYR